MASDEQEIVGRWNLSFRVRTGSWKWEYTFSADHTVKWRDPYNNMTGSGRWLKQGKLINIAWNNSTTKESWYCPINPRDQNGWIDASYGVGQFQAEKIVAPQTRGDEDYTDLEPAIDLPSSPPPENIMAYVPAPPGVRRGSKPIYDDETNAVIGFMYQSLGYYEFYDLNGTRVATDEIPLDTPLLDPIDFVMIVGGLARGLGQAALRIGIRAAASVGSKAFIRTLTSTVVAGMRSTFRAAISLRVLKFTATTAQRMATKGRYVPVHLLKMAIRYGTREADPKGVKGAFQYTIKIIRSEPNIAPGLNPAASWAGRTYTLKVVVKEEITSSTVLHFHYQ